MLRLCLIVTTALLGACNYRGYNAAKAGPAYPFDAHTTDTAQVQVFRDGTDISLVNATATSWGAARIWVNQRFSHRVKGLAAGQTLSLDLHDFWDEDGESFPAGGFLATRPAMPVRLVELREDKAPDMIGFFAIPVTGEH